MPQSNDFSQISENLPLILLGIFFAYMLIRSILSKTGLGHKQHDIDAMIRKSKLRFQSDYAGAQSNSEGPTVKQQLKEIDDPQIKELLNAMEWGDSFNFPILTIPFSRVGQRTLFQYKRILNLKEKIDLSNASEFFEYIEQQINNYYLENPLEDFPDDDILSATNLLGVLQDDSIDKIKKRYHLLSKKYHPDTFSKEKLSEAKQKSLQQNYKIIQKAYTILSEREKK